MKQPVDADIVASISALLTEFCWCADNGAGDRIAALFNEDARIDTPNSQLSGREEIDRWFTERAGTKLSRHTWMNLRITILGYGRYRAETNMITATGALPAPQQGGKIAFTNSTDEIVIRDGDALFARRRLDLAFEGVITGSETAA